MEPSNDGSARHGVADQAGKRAGWKQRPRTTTLGIPKDSVPLGTLYADANDAVGACDGSGTETDGGGTGTDGGSVHVDDGQETERADRGRADRADEIVRVGA